MISILMVILEKKEEEKKEMKKKILYMEDSLLCFSFKNKSIPIANIISINIWFRLDLYNVLWCVFTRNFVWFICI